MLSRWRPMGPRLALDTATAILRLDDGQSVRVQIRCNAEPIKPEEMARRVGRGDGQERLDNWKKFYINAGQTSRRLRPGDGQQREHDQIEYQGVIFEVDAVLDYGVYLEVRAVREAQ